LLAALLVAAPASAQLQHGAISGIILDDLANPFLAPWLT